MTIARGAGQHIHDVLARFEDTARERLPREVYDFYAGGSGDEVTLDEASPAWAQWRIRPRVLRDVSRVDTSCELLGSRLAAPVLTAPIAFQCFVHPEGETAMAAGVRSAGGLSVVSTRCTRPLSEVAAAAGGWWFQVYVTRDRRLMWHAVVRAADLGAAALVVTGDTPFIGTKRRPGAVPLTDEEFLAPFGPDATMEGADQDPSADLSVVGELAARTGLPVLVKGVLRGDDARACLEAGAAGVVVSNHGGRQLDRAVASADALPDVVDAVGGQGPVLVDGGIRSGLDVLVALALGARAVLVGRPALWALAAEGADGVHQWYDALRADIAATMALAGVRSLDDIDRSFLA